MLVVGVVSVVLAALLAVGAVARGATAASAAQAAADLAVLAAAEASRIGAPTCARAAAVARANGARLEACQQLPAGRVRVEVQWGGAHAAARAGPG